MRERLTREDWLQHGLRALAQDGPEALRADRLSRGLGVSRGSFYWHFTDLAAFHSALVACWLDRSTGALIRETPMAVDPKESLRRLLRAAFGGDVRLERAVRAWAAVAPVAAHGLLAADRSRMAHLVALMPGRPTPAIARARFLYDACIGRIMRGAEADSPMSSVEEIGLAVAGYSNE